MKMTCQGCGENKKLIKAHIIPESFWVGLRDGKRPPLLITDNTGQYPQRRPIGVYDKEILCHDCENVFQEVDYYGYNILIKDEEKHKAIIHDNKTVGFTISNVDCNLLKKFFLSVLWRASISKSNFFSKIDLGPHEDIIKTIAWGNNHSKNNYYDCVISKFTDNQLGRAILDPHMEKVEGVNFARLYMFGYIIFIKIDKRPCPKFFQPFIIESEKDITIIGRDLLQSKEYPLLFKIAQQAKQ